MVGANVRGGLLEYYQTMQPNFEGFVRMAIDLRLQARRTMAPYVDFMADSALVKLKSPWLEVDRNDYFRNPMEIDVG